MREAFPGVPIVADLKTMDGGYLEAEMMAKAGATHVVVMARAHEETIKCVVKAGKDFGVKVMGDNLGCEDMIAAAKWLEDLGCDYIIHHIGYDERRGIAAQGNTDAKPVGSVTGSSESCKYSCAGCWWVNAWNRLFNALHMVRRLVVLGAPLTIDADAFKTADGNLEDIIAFNLRRDTCI